MFAAELYEYHKKETRRIFEKYFLNVIETQICSYFNLENVIYLYYLYIELLLLFVFYVRFMHPLLNTFVK